MKANLLLLPICFFLVCCKKNSSSEDKPQPLNMRFSADALTYVQLPVNRYFIYKDSATGVLDSVVVTQSKVEETAVAKRESSGLFDPGTPAYTAQKFTLVLTKVTPTAGEWFYGEAWASNVLFGPYNTDTAALKLLERNRAANADRGYVFYYPLSQATVFPLTRPTVTELPLLTVEGKSYANVGMIFNESTLDVSNPYYLTTTYYWVKGLGIIKREIRTSNAIKTDLLVRYN